jgi:HAMP domain-containing protein
VRTAELQDLREAAGAFERLRQQPEDAMEELATLRNRHRISFP